MEMHTLARTFIRIIALNPAALGHTNTVSTPSLRSHVYVPTCTNLKTELLVFTTPCNE